MACVVDWDTSTSRDAVCDDSSDDLLAFEPHIPFLRCKTVDTSDIPPALPSVLGVKNTFYTVMAPEHPEQRTRCASAPPRFAAAHQLNPPKISGGEFLPGLKAQTPSPSRKARRGRRARCIAPPAPRFAVDFNVPSRGSKNHFNGRQCKPCREFHMNGSCESGRLCNFCHYDHEELMQQVGATQHNAKILCISDALPWTSSSTEASSGGDLCSTASSSEHERWWSPGLASL